VRGRKYHRINESAGQANVMQNWHRLSEKQRCQCWHHCYRSPPPPIQQQQQQQRQQQQQLVVFITCGTGWH
jgi:hypothetical protein